MLLAFVIWLWREDNRRHNDENALLRKERIDEGRVDRALLINTLQEVAAALESITQAVKDSSETIAVASRITDAFVKKMESGNGNGAANRK